MSDPFSTVVVNATVGAATKEIMGKSAELGRKWLGDKFAQHQDEVVAKANDNASDFLNRLAEKVQRIEDENKLNKAMVESVLADPSYSLFLQKSLLSAAETSSVTKHDMLARLVADRTRHTEEDIYSLCSPLAVDAISRSTPTQLKMLALQHYIFSRRHAAGLSEQDRAEAFFHCVAPFMDAELREQDMLHLMSLSCVCPVAFPLQAFKYVDSKFGDGEKIWDVLSRYGDMNPFIKVWNAGPLYCYPTSVGDLVGSVAFTHFHGQGS